MRLFRNVQCLLAASVLAACGAETTGDEGAFEELDASEVAALADDDAKSDLSASVRRALPAGATHLYFGRPDTAYVGEDQDGDVREDLAYRWFVAKGGHEFKVGATTLDVTTTDGSVAVAPGSTLGFKLQRLVKRFGRYEWQVVARADGPGLAYRRYLTPRSPATSVYLLTVTAAPLPQQLRIDLGCRGDNPQACAPALQPGQSCGGDRIGPRLSCDEGLYCSYTLEAMCGFADAPGTCEIRPSLCPHGIRYFPVCGCDGRTYDGGCNAARAGVSVQRIGACEINIAGPWTGIADSGAHLGYEFHADGSFQVSSAPGCLYTTPSCRLPTRLYHGTYEVLSDEIHLTYGDGGREGQTAIFRSTVIGVDQILAGNDFDTHVELRRLTR